MADSIQFADSPERVALDLAKLISVDEAQDRDEKYWLHLYSRCLAVALRQEPSAVLQEK